jgi:hypothetical protein
MSPPLAIGAFDVATFVLAMAIGVGAGVLWVRRRHGVAPVRRILLPFTGRTISRRALDAALRLAAAENATLMPAYLAVVPLRLPLDCALPRQASTALTLLEAIDQRAADRGVPVDSRVESGRTYRHALVRLLEAESFDRVIVPATAVGERSFTPSDVAWLLDDVEAEVVILRPDPGDRRVISGNGSDRRLAAAATRQNGSRPPDPS